MTENPEIGSDLQRGTGAPVHERSGSTERLAEHYAGRLGEAIVVALERPDQAVGRLTQIQGAAETIVGERGLHRSLQEYGDTSLADDSAVTEARESGSFHSVIAVAEEVTNELKHERADPSLRPSSEAVKECRDVANALLNLDFNAALELTSRPLDERDGTAAKVAQSYMYGVRRILDGIISTVRARLQRRVAAIFDAPQAEASELRLGTLLFVALTNYPSMRITAALGSEYGDLLTDEEKNGRIGRVNETLDSPLVLTQDGQAEIRELLRKTG